MATGEDAKIGITNTETDVKIGISDNEPDVKIGILNTEHGAESFFHSIFGAEFEEVLVEKNPNFYREKWYNFLKQFKSIDDEQLPLVLRDQLEPLFNLMLKNPGSTSEMIQELFQKTRDRKFKIKQDREKLIDDIVNRFHKDKEFSNKMSMILKLCDENFVITENNSDQFKGKIRSKIKLCAFAYDTSLNDKKFNKQYCSHNLLTNLIRSEEFFKTYIESVRSSNYFVHFEEIGLLVTLFNIKIGVYYNEETYLVRKYFTPNEEYFNNEFKVNFMPTEIKSETIVFFDGLNFSRAQLYNEEFFDNNQSKNQDSVREAFNKFQNYIEANRTDYISDEVNIDFDEIDDNQNSDEADIEDDFSDISDFETATVPNDLKPKRWQKSQIKTRKRNTQKKFTGCKKIFNDTNQEFIESNLKDDILEEILSCKFVYFGDKILKLESVGDGVYYMLSKNFVYQISISSLRINFSTESFFNIKKQIIQSLTITKILTDTLLERRDDAYTCLVSAFKSTDQIDDFYQLYKVLMLTSLNLSSQDFLLKLSKNIYMSANILNRIRTLWVYENEVAERNKDLPKFNPSLAPQLSRLVDKLREICKAEIEKNRKIMLDICPPLISFPKIFTDISRLTDLQIMCLKTDDVKLFTELVDITDQQSYPADHVQFDFTENSHRFIMDSWQNLLQKIRPVDFAMQSVKEVGKLTNVWYPYLYKSFLEYMVEINKQTGLKAAELFHNSSSKWKTNKTISWPTPSIYVSTIQRQYVFLGKLLNEYKIASETSYEHKYNLKFLKKSVKPAQDQMVWVYVLDDAIQGIIDYQKSNGGLTSDSEDKFNSLCKTIVTAFLKFLQDSPPDNYESFRSGLHGLIKFMAKITPYMVKLKKKPVSGFRKIFKYIKVLSDKDDDQKILEDQVAFISKMLQASTTNSFSKYFSSLIDVFTDYWEYRDLIIERIYQKFDETCLDGALENLKNSILKILISVHSIDVDFEDVIHFYRTFNEFLKLLENVPLDWFIKEFALCGNLKNTSVVECVNSEKQTYKVINLNEFAKTYIDDGLMFPDHDQIKILLKQTELVEKVIKRTIWSPKESISAASDLLYTISQTLFYFKDQQNYTIFTSFYNENTKPYESVVENSKTFADFKTRLGNVEKMFVFSKKINEIDIDMALDIFANNSRQIPGEFDSTYDEAILKSSYDVYEAQFNEFVQMYGVSQILDIIKDLVQQDREISTWDQQYKQKIVPRILAGLGAIWSIRESKDLACVNQCLKPHCIQILCILRLVSVDENSTGINHHLAQVLTGQGKSIILGLLSALLAIHDHNVRIVCYSKYLANRDSEDFFDYFESLNGFNVNRNISYGVFDDMSNETICVELNGQTENLRSLQKKLVLNELPRQSGNLVISKIDKTILLIDEVDVFFSDSFYGNTYAACNTIGFKLLEEIQIEIWKTVSSGNHNPVNICNILEEFIVSKGNKNCDKEFFKFYNTTKTIFYKHINKMIQNAIHVFKGNDSNWYINRYKINEDDCISYRSQEGLYTLHVFPSYYNVFNYFRLKKKNFDSKNFKNFGYLNVSTGHVSYAKLPNEYPLILGVSGTITTLNKPEMNAIQSYNIRKISSVPTFFGSHKLKFSQYNDFVIHNEIDDWFRNMYSSANSKIQSGRSVLIFFDSEIELYKFHNEYHTKINRLQILTGNEDLKTLSWNVNESGVAKTITLATRLMGRGVDYKSNDSGVEKNGGVHVIQTFFSIDIKEEIQIKGRTARKYNEGSYELILLRKQLEDIYCSTNSSGSVLTSYSELCTTREKLCGEKGEQMAKKIAESDKKHAETMKFLKSFSNYTPEKRSQYFNEYPMNEEELK